MYTEGVTGNQKRKSRIISLIEQNIARTPHHLIQKNPFFPDLLNQPEFLIVPEAGRLVALYVYTPRRHLSWRRVLAMAEDLFEIKIATGESTVVAGFLVPQSDIGNSDTVYFALLNNLFDFFALVDAGDEQSRCFGHQGVGASPTAE